MIPKAHDAIVLLLHTLVHSVSRSTVSFHFKNYSAEIRKIEYFTSIYLPKCRILSNCNTNYVF